MINKELHMQSNNAGSLHTEGLQLMAAMEEATESISEYQTMQSSLYSSGKKLDTGMLLHVYTCTQQKISSMAVIINTW